MEPIAMLYADPLDILFENRNKSYGAYPLRKYYAQRMYISIGCTLTLVTLSSFAYFFFRPANVLIGRWTKPLGDVYITPIELYPVKPVSQVVKQFAAKPPANLASTTPVIVADQHIPNPIATVDELQKAVIGLTTTAGTADPGGPQSTGVSNTGTAINMADSPDTKSEILDKAEIMPEFPGGIEALKRYLLKNLRMPENELDPGTQVQVMARFVVDMDGRVKNIEITQPAGEAFDKEVNRVISKMPDWKPGMQNHRRVAVYFSLPVNFVNAE